MPFFEVSLPSLPSHVVEAADSDSAYIHYKRWAGVIESVHPPAITQVEPPAAEQGGEPQKTEPPKEPSNANEPGAGGGNQKSGPRKN